MAVSSSGNTGTTLSMAMLVIAVHTSTVAVLIIAALLAGVGQGMGQLGGLSLLNSSVPPQRLAEANAALNVGGYIPAGLVPVSAGYLSDAVDLTRGATIFGAVLMGLAVIGGLVVLTTRRQVTDPA
ncbi:MFS transporter [Microtetraspora malaysiensis]|uniref:MFS transporter n=1 Tax=Microtetraspora malaysiensis TaxID=161358 RepID=UPI003D90B0F7